MTALPSLPEFLNDAAIPLATVGEDDLAAVAVFLKSRTQHKRVKVEVPSYFATKYHCAPRFVDYAFQGHNHRKAEEMMNKAVLETCRRSVTPCFMNNGGTFQVKKVCRLENTTLFEQHTRFIKDAKLQLGDKAHKERLEGIFSGLPDWLQQLAKKNIKDQGVIYALHGTCSRNLDSILKHGLQSKYSLNSFGFYGKGIYFTDSACKASQYTHARTSGVILVCRVFIGKVEVLAEKSEDKRVPRKGYNSAMAKRGHTDPKVGNGNKQLHNEFIIYADGAVYPEFVIHFKQTG